MTEDLRRDVTGSQLEDLVNSENWFPFVEEWSTRSAAQFFQALVDSPYGGGLREIPKIAVGFTPQEFKFSIPNRFRKSIPQLAGRAILTNDVDNIDLRVMNAITDFYTEEIRLSTSKRKFVPRTPIQIWDTDKKQILEKARTKYGDEVTPYNLRNEVVYYTKESNPFRPSIALAVYSLFNARSILDMSSGWGDRLIGAMAWARRSGHSVRYQGFDPFCELQRAYTAMIQDFGDDGFSVTCLPFEEGEIEGVVDLAFTSPPYFDFEEYAISDTSSTQSIIRHPTVGGWVQGFLKPTMLKAAKSLKLGGHLALNIEGTFMYGVLDHSAEFFRQNGLRMEYQGIIGYRSDRPRDIFIHPIFVWRRVA